VLTGTSDVDRERFGDARRCRRRRLRSAQRQTRQKKKKKKDMEDGEVIATVRSKRVRGSGRPYFFSSSHIRIPDIRTSGHRSC
jgi:hypothetical protein